MKRRGMTMIELVVAGAMLAALLVVCLKMFHAAADWRRECDRKRFARIECENVMERLAALPWDKLDEQAAAEQRLSERAAGMLPGAELKTEITRSPSDEKPAWKRIAVSIVRRDTSGEKMAPLTLATWRYLPEKPKKAEEKQETEEAKPAVKDDKEKPDIEEKEAGDNKDEAEKAAPKKEDKTEGEKAAPKKDEAEEKSDE